MLNEVTITSEDFVLIAIGGIHLLWVFSPLLPAILIYKLFPTTHVAVKGPLSGLTVNATGAFAGYLIIFIATYPITSNAQNIIAGFQKPYWTVHAEVVKEGGDILAGSNREEITGLSVKTEPEAHYVANNLVRINIPEGENLPFLIFKVDDYSRVIDLQKVDNIVVDYFHKEIHVQKPIILTRTSSVE